MITPPLLAVADLRVRYDAHGWFGRASGPTVVDGVSFALDRGRTLAIVGESGSGKSTLARAMVGLTPIASGRVTIDGIDVAAARRSERRRLCRAVQMIFQDPGGSLNPRMRVGEAVAEPMHVHGVHATRADRRRAAASLLERCGLPADAATRFPHEFSGGQRQRVAIARALALSPSLLVCDEPTSALDVSVQAQVLNLLTDLQRDLGMAMLLITHDLGVARHMADDAAVMKRGIFVEAGPAAQVLVTPSSAVARDLVAASS